MKLIFCTIFFVLSISSSSSGSLLTDDVIESVIKEFKDCWKSLKRTNFDGKTDAKSIEDLADILRRIPPTIGRLERSISSNEYDQVLKSLGNIQNTPDNWFKKWSEIQVLTAPIDVLYGHFKIFPEMPESFNVNTKAGVMDFNLLALADMILKPMYSTDDKSTITLKYLLDHAHQREVAGGDKDTFSSLADHTEGSLNNTYWCLVGGKTAQMVIYGMYEMLVISDVKEYALYNMANMIRFVFNKTTEDKQGLEEAKEILISRNVEKKLAARNSIVRVSPSYWRCDPEKYIEGVNYDQFKELLQGYIENENQMHQSGSCRESCSNYNYVKGKCNYPSMESCHQLGICTGNIVECEFIAADSKVCLSKNPSRRFDWINYKGGPVLGKDESCDGEEMKKDSHWRFLYHCSNCFCLCDDPYSPSTVRHVSLAAVTSDVQSNKVVTGVRFKIQDGILHLQISQGVCVPNGKILDERTDWKPSKELSKHSSEVFQMDYMNRHFDLDDVQVPNDFVVTGVRFRKLGAHINLEVQATQVNSRTGELYLSTRHWVSNDNTPENEKGRELLEIPDPDVPTLTKLPSIPDSKHDQYVKFGPSSRSKDVSQTTIPFFDIQNVQSNPPTWLQGIGIFHKGREGYGGFLAPRIYTKSIVNFMNV